MSAMQISTRYLIGLVLRVLLVLPLCILLWVWAWRPLSEPPMMLASAMLNVSSAIHVNKLTLQDREAHFALAITSNPGTRTPPQAEVELEFSPLKYTFGLPFFIALMLASRGKQWRRKLLLGGFVILIFQAASFSFDVLAQLMLDPQLDIIFQPVWGTASRTLIALCYQSGTLIFPAVLPIALWFIFNRRMLLGLVVAGAMEE